MNPNNDCMIVEVGYWVDPKRHLFTRGKYCLVEQLDQFIQYRQNVGIFKTVFSYNQMEIDNALLYGDLYFDFDALGQFEYARQDAIMTIAFLKTVFKIPEEQVQIFFSGSKGIHLIVPANVLGVEPCLNLNQTYRYIAKQANQYLKNQTLDLMIYDKKRLFRIPNTIHEKTGLHKIELSLSELRQLPFETIQERAIYPQQKNKKIINISTNSFANKQYHYYRNEALKEIELLTKKSNQRQTGQVLRCTPPCISYLLEQGAKEGFRNNTVAALASFYKSKGYSLNEASEELIQWNQEKNSPPLSEREIIRTTQSIFYGYSRYGCNKLKELSVCEVAKCPLKKGR
ncbi:MAG: primase C-terminal domain-containing protein [Turicibacter sp.]|nr:primase C-terminal domain-containing protein [Turicibacter sp.]